MFQPPEPPPARGDNIQQTCRLIDLLSTKKNVGSVYLLVVSDSPYGVSNGPDTINRWSRQTHLPTMRAILNILICLS